MRYLTTLYITDHRARLAAKGRSLVVAAGDGSKTRVPIEALEAVVIVGHGQVTSDALALCVEKHVRVTSLRGSGIVRFAVDGGVSGSVHLRRAQHRIADDIERTQAIARTLVIGKLQNAQRMMNRWSWDAPIGPRRVIRNLMVRVEAAAQAVVGAENGDHVRGCEGEGTRAYFEGLRVHLANARVPFSFETRSRRPPRDPVNATLSFVYGLLLADILGRLDGVGLDPQIGFLHQPRSGRPALALDLIEEFRAPFADRFAVRLLTRRILGPESFTTTMGAACYLSDGGRRTLLTEYEGFKAETVTHTLLERTVPRAALTVIQATLMARHLRGDLAVYPPFVGAR